MTEALTAATDSGTDSVARVANVSQAGIDVRTVSHLAGTGERWRTLRQSLVSRSRWTDVVVGGGHHGKVVLSRWGCSQARVATQ
jgi:hypothetical protein